MARSLGGVYVAGATLALIWAVLPSPAQSDTMAIAVIAAVAEVVGMLLLSGLLDKQPQIVFEGAVAFATLLISLADYFARVRGTGLPYLYMWCTPFAYWFFPRRRALVQAGLVVVGFAAAALAASAHNAQLAGAASSDWGAILMLAGTVLIVGELVRRLGMTIDESHQRFARIFAAAPTPMARISVHGRMLDANEAFCDAVGRERSDVVGSTVAELVGPAQLSRVQESRARLLAGGAQGQQLELELHRPDGSLTNLVMNVSLLGRSGRPDAEMFVQALDLTERKRTEEALAESERRYRTLLETSQAVVWSSDTAGRFTFVNEMACEVLGYEPHELLGRPAVHMLTRPERERIRPDLDRLWVGEPIMGEAEHLRAGGEVFIARYSVAPLRDETGALTGLVGTLVDITESRRAEEALRLSEVRLRAIIDNAPAAITIRDTSGRVLALNREAARFFEQPAEELIGKTYTDLHPPDEAAEMQQSDQQVLERGEAAFYESKHRFRDREYIFLAVAFPLPGGPGERPQICRISFDVTDREQARQELLRSHEQRRRLLAELVRAQEDERRRIAADVHDESIQVLAGVAIRLGMLSGMLERPEQRRLIEGLDESVRRGIKSLRQLLFDLRLPALDELGLAAALGSYLSETIAREGVTYVLQDHLELEPPPELRTVLYRVAQEALSNVRKHAHAGHVEVELGSTTEGFTVIVRDDGVGFDAAATPDEVPGHLGMVGMRERIAAAGGWIEVRSEPGQGTTVRFGVPAQKQALALSGGRDGGRA